MKMFDTVAAISTPYGKGGIAVIRVSGPDAISAAQKAFTPKNGKSLSDIASNRMVYGNIYRTARDGGKVCIDDGMAVVFRAPHSFTGEDTVEINCHGGILVTSEVLKAVLEGGARMAQAGEFTRRAFVSGRLGLTQAEALGNLLDAQNDNQLLLARGGIKGILSSEIGSMYDELKSILSNIYAAIDFPDEDLSAMNRDEMQNGVARVRENAEKLASTYRTGRAIAEGIPTVICGRTNVGKSSVYNRLVGYDAAIVTDIEGTTRDLIKETVQVGGVTLRLCDTAGMRRTEDKVESIGIGRAVAELDKAELIITVFDASRALDSDDTNLINSLKSVKEREQTVIALLNKSDECPCAKTLDTVTNAFENVLKISAKNNTGFDELEKLISSLFIDGTINISNDAVLTDARQFDTLLHALKALTQASSAIADGISLDLCCIDIEEAMQELGNIDGREVGEDIVAEIFSKFCVGK